jgi:hypothetical protein
MISRLNVVWLVPQPLPPKALVNGRWRIRLDERLEAGVWVGEVERFRLSRSSASASPTFGMSYCPQVEQLRQ